IFQYLNYSYFLGAWAPGSPDSDYEFWTPTNYKGDKCVFGRKARYIRRKREAACFNSQEYDKKIFVEPCECTEDDWECDIGFYRKNDDGQCVPMNKTYEAKLKNVPPPDCKGWYEVTQGYRRVPGDYCSGGVDHSVQIYQCPER